jgi:hypothetical protein
MYYHQGVPDILGDFNFMMVLSGRSLVLSYRSTN